MKLTKTKLRTIIKEELQRLNEAEEISFGELDQKEQKFIHSITKIINVGKIDSVWDGIHGKIIKFNNDKQPDGYRLYIDELKKLAKLPIRWIESDEKYLNIGF